MTFVLSTETDDLWSASFIVNEQENGEVHFEKTPLILPIPYNMISFQPVLVGSCNGLLCLHISRKFSFYTFLLWNPTTRTHHHVPDPPYGPEMEQKGFHNDVHGLGYAETNYDFKFVIVCQFVGTFKSIDPDVWVYSLKSDSWKKINSDNFPYHLKFGRGVTDVFVNGSLHYTMNKKTKSSDERENDIIDSEDLIVAFVISEEIFGLVPKPAFVESDKEFELGVLDGRLCMLVDENNNAGRYRLVEMQEYGNRSSWNELFRFERDELPIGMRPIVTSLGNQKHVLMEGGQKLFYFHVGSNSLRVFYEEDNEFVEVCIFIRRERRLDSDDDDSSTSDEDEDQEDEDEDEDQEDEVEDEDQEDDGPNPENDVIDP